MRSYSSFRKGTILCSSGEENYVLSFDIGHDMGGEYDVFILQGLDAFNYYTKFLLILLQPVIDRKERFDCEQALEE